jgi:hypothetical protein
MYETKGSVRGFIGSFLSQFNLLSLVLYVKLIMVTEKKMGAKMHISQGADINTDEPVMVFSQHSTRQGVIGGYVAAIRLRSMNKKSLLHILLNPNPGS